MQEKLKLRLFEEENTIWVSTAAHPESTLYCNPDKVNEANMKTPIHFHETRLVVLIFVRLRCFQFI